MSYIIVGIAVGVIGWIWEATLENRLKELRAAMEEDLISELGQSERRIINNFYLSKGELEKVE